MNLGGAPDRKFSLSEQMVASRNGLSVMSLPRGTPFGIHVRGGGLRSVTVLLQADSLLELFGEDASHLPENIRDITAGRLAGIEQHSLHGSVQQIAEELLASNKTDIWLPDLYYAGKLYQLIWSVLEQIHPERSARPQPLHVERARQSIERVKQVIDEDPCANRPIDQLGRIAAMNRTKLRAMFKEVYGTTIADYRTELRMRHADELLQARPGLTVTEIAFEVGYSDASSFIVAYRRHFGRSPDACASTSGAFGCVERRSHLVQPDLALRPIGLGLHARRYDAGCFQSPAYALDRRCLACKNEMRAACRKAQQRGFCRGEMGVVGDTLDQRRVSEADRRQHQLRLRDVRDFEHMNCTVRRWGIAECRRQAERGFIAEQDHRRFKAG